MVRTRGLRKSYTTGTVETEVLHGLDLDLAAGQIGVILGPSGSGKSTLMNLVGGIARADEGEVTVDGVRLDALSDDALTDYRRREVGFVFQFYNLVPDLTAAENIEVVSNISTSPLDIDTVLGAVGLADLGDRFPRELSGGEQQRVAIARAIVKNPKIMLCDEPTGALDYETSRNILTLLQQINATYGTTILMITHNSAIAALAHRVYRLRSGTIEEQRTNATPEPAERIQW